MRLYRLHYHSLDRVCRQLKLNGTSRMATVRLEETEDERISDGLFRLQRERGGGGVEKVADIRETSKYVKTVLSLLSRTTGHAYRTSVIRIRLITVEMLLALLLDFTAHTVAMQLDYKQRTVNNDTKGNSLYMQMADWHG